MSVAGPNLWGEILGEGQLAPTPARRSGESSVSGVWAGSQPKLNLVNFCLKI